MTPQEAPLPLAANVIGSGIGLAVTAWMLVRSLKTGRAGQAYGKPAADRKTDPFNYWTSLAIGVGLFVVALVLAGRWVLTH
jgi:hypothetical protein